VDLLTLNTLRATKTAFLTPKRYDEHPHPFYIGVPPGLGELSAVSKKVEIHPVLIIIVYF